MKVNFDGFVPYASSQGYSCARGCSGCSSSQRKDSPELILDEVFYDTLYAFIQKNDITYDSISFNCCGNFLENFSDFFRLLRMLSDKKFLKKGIKILCYSDGDSLGKYSSKIKFLSRFKELITFQIGISLILSGDIESVHEQVSKIHAAKLGFSGDLNIQTHIVIQRGNMDSITTDTMDSIGSAIDSLAQDFPMTWAESEGILLPVSEIKKGLFTGSGLSSCPFVDKNWIEVDNQNFSFYMLDISLAGLRPHGPGCENNPHLLIGTLQDDIESLSAGANRLKEALKKMNFDYNQSHTDRDICKFCRKNIQNFL